uniref:Uncharacterized protein n=1 Tax=Panagrolaimus superbus TaxID=310955 RepID=A0A914YJ38_9BILA
MGENNSQEALKSAFQSFLKNCTDDSLRKQQEMVEDLVKSIQFSDRLPEPFFKHVYDAVVDVAVNRLADREYFLNFEKLIYALSAVDSGLSLKYLAESVQNYVVPSVALLK